MLNRDEINIKVVALDEIDNFAVNNFFHLRSFEVSNIQYKIQNCIVKKIAQLVCTLKGTQTLWS